MALWRSEVARRSSQKALTLLWSFNWPIFGEDIRLLVRLAPLSLSVGNSGIVGCMVIVCWQRHEKRNPERLTSSWADCGDSAHGVSLHFTAHMDCSSIMVVAFIVYGRVFLSFIIGCGTHLPLLLVADRVLHIVYLAFLTPDILHNEFGCLTWCPLGRVPGFLDAKLRRAYPASTSHRLLMATQSFRQPSAFSF